MNLKTEPRGHTASITQNNELLTLFQCDSSQTVKNMAEQLGIHYQFPKLCKVKDLNKWVPHQLTK